MENLEDYAVTEQPDGSFTVWKDGAKEPYRVQFKPAICT